MATLVKNRSGKYEGKVAGSCYRELVGGNVEFWHIYQKRYLVMSKRYFDMEYTVERVSQ